MAFSKELEDVIEAALADGVITEKERAVLHKKALLEGVDPDEVDVVIDGRLQQIQKSIDDAKQKVRKCPSCGEIIPAMTAVCPSCGQVIDASNADNKALAVYMDKLETALVKLKENGASKYNNKVKAELESMIRQGRAMYGDNKKIAYLISEVEASISKFDKSHKNQFIVKIVGATLVVLLLGGWIIKCSSDRNDKTDAFLAQGQAQCDSLCNLIDNIPTPDKTNYKECERILLAITWHDIPCPFDDHELNDRVNGDSKYDYSTKFSYLEKKRALASQIYSVYEEVFPDEDRSSWSSRHAPKQIFSPDVYIEN